MPRYARLKEPDVHDSDELFEVGEVGMTFLEKIVDHPVPPEEERAQEQKSIREHIYAVPSTEILNPTKLQFPPGCTHNFQPQQPPQHQQNIENGNPNVCSPDPSMQPTIVAPQSHCSTASGAALLEQQGGGAKIGSSVSGRWAGRSVEERSSRCRAPGCESHHQDTASSQDDGNVDFSTPSSRSGCGAQWATSVHRGAPNREREPVLNHQHQEAQPQYPFPHDGHSCTLHSSCNGAYYCHRFSRESSPREETSNDPKPGQEKAGFSVMHPRLDAAHGSCLSQERNPTFQRNNSGRGAPGLQRSGSTRDAPTQASEMSVEIWRDHPASRSVHVSDKTKHRVSFSLTENHELETQKLREKFREPTASGKKVLQAKQQTKQQPLRYNYEQPGFVEREKENICGGKAYTIYGVKEVKECPKGSSGRHHQLVRAFSLRDSNTQYTKIARARSVNAGGGRHVMPMECDTCGKGGIGIVFLGLPGSESSFCKACKPEWGSSESKPPRKKKSIMEYCRKLLRFPQKSR